MKTYKVLLISTVVLGLLLGGVLAFQTQASVVQVTARVNPPFYSLEDPIPMYFMITLTNFPKPYKPEDVNASTLLVGSVVPMATQVEESDEWPKIAKNSFKFKVEGDPLMYWVVLPYIWHMGFPPHTRVPIDVTVEGQFYNGQEFQGTFTLTVFTEKPELDPNNPPPPP